MDLHYPDCDAPNLTATLKNKEIMYEVVSKVLLSLDEIPTNLSVSRAVKRKLIKLIKHDSCSILAEIDKHMVSFEQEIGEEEHRETLLHFIAKFNAVKILKLLLRKVYQ